MAIEMRALPIRHLQQPDDSSCGPTCFAMLNGLSVAEAKQKMFGNGERQIWYTDWPRMRKAFEQSDLVLGRSERAASWDKISGLALVLCGAPGPMDDVSTHWVIYDPRELPTVFDPALDGPTPAQLRHTRLRSFALITDA